MLILFECVAVLTLAFVLFTSANKYVALFLVLAMVSQFYPFYGRSSYVAFHAVLYGCILYAAIVIYGDGKTAKTMMDMLCIVALFNVGLQVLQVMKIDPIFRALDGGPSLTTGFMTNVNETSALLAFCFPAFMRKWWVVCIPILCFGFIQARSSGGVVATVIGLCVYGIMTGYWWTSLIALACHALYWVQIDAPNVSASRLEVTMKGWEAYKEHWIAGYGLGHWKMVFLNKNIHPSYFAQAHNEYIQTLFEMGIGFALIFSGYMVNIARRIRNDKRLHLPITALVIILINCSVNFPMHVAPTAAIIIIWLSILELELRRAV